MPVVVIPKVVGCILKNEVDESLTDSLDMMTGSVVVVVVVVVT